MKQFKLIDIITGWIVFAIATYVYASTAESAGSLWDCGEFISACLKLQVVHPPGAPLFLMLGRIFSLLTDDPTKKAYFMNLISAVSSSGAIMFVFWIITGLAKRLLVTAKEETISLEKTILIIGSGLVGSLACTFMDTMWFSAVEGEVYALSTFFIVIVFWGIMKWEAEADKPYANRWLVFVSFMIGLSIGVHLLSLLVIPVAVLIYYFKKFKPSLLGIILSLIIGFVVLAIVQVGVIQYLTKIAGGMELFLVNTFGLPFNSGIILFYLLYIGGLIAVILFAGKERNGNVQLIALCLLVLSLGFSSYAMVPIRAHANPPINMNKPEDAFSMLSYLNREQYGSRPLLWGPQYDAKPIKYVDKGKDYFKNFTTGKYEVKKVKKDLGYDEGDKSFYPRMWSSEDNHVGLYQAWTGKSAPTPDANWKYFFKYQIGYMYWRYFFWNFAGRQDTNQGTYDNQVQNGNWISGVSFIDNARLGSQENLPSAITREKGRNKYFFLPFIFGLIGLWYLIDKNPRWALVNILLFGITGILLIVYSNEPPVEPRERDYALVGSFIVYCMWIGLGVLGIQEWLKKLKVPGVPAAIAVTILGLVAVPTLMGKQAWDDHNRSGRYMARDFASNFLESCPKNAILFTQGDNDTYPLWYAQEVEGVRPDVRVVNLSLLGVDWYIESMQRAANQSGPLPFYKEFTVDKYRGDKRDYLQFLENQNVVNPNEYYDIQKVMSFILSDDQSLMAMNQQNQAVNYLPTTKFRLKVDKEKAAQYCGLPDSLKNKIVDEITWDLGKNTIIKFDLAVLALVAGGDWSRPICFANTVEPGYYNGLDKYLIQKGLCSQLVPVKFEQNQERTIATDIDYTYKVLMEKFKYGGLESREMFVDENSYRLMANMKATHLKLADELSRIGRKEESVKVLENMRAKIKPENVPYYNLSPTYYNGYSISWISLYYRNNRPDLAEKIYDSYIKDLSECMRFFNQNNSFSRNYGQEMQSGMEDIKNLFQMAVAYKDDKLSARLKKEFPGLLPQVQLPPPTN